MSKTSSNSFNYLVCKVCSKYYLNPVILPCGNNVCEEHVSKKLGENNSKIYKCDICFGCLCNSYIKKVEILKIKPT